MSALLILSKKTHRDRETEKVRRRRRRRRLQFNCSSRTDSFTCTDFAKSVCKEDAAVREGKKAEAKALERSFGGSGSGECLRGNRRREERW